MKEAYASMYNQPVEPENIDERKYGPGPNPYPGSGRSVGGVRAEVGGVRAVVGGVRGEFKPIKTEFRPIKTEIRPIKTEIRPIKREIGGSGGKNSSNAPTRPNSNPPSSGSSSSNSSSSGLSRYEKDLKYEKEQRRKTKELKKKHSDLRSGNWKAYSEDELYGENYTPERVNETIIRKDGSITHGAPKGHGLKDPKGGKKPSAESPKGKPRKNTGHPVKIINGKPVKMPAPGMREDYTSYDIVLEYLLSTEQAATIEEANYIMTEMDAKTIQDIVAQQLNEQN